MDGHRFDAFAKALALPSSRRRLLRGAVGGALGAALGLRGKQGQAACAPGQPCTVDAQCCRNQVCANGTCVLAGQLSGCPTGQIRCNGTCVTPATDPMNCNGCGVVCAAPANATATCAGGVCGFSCTSGFADCDGNPTNGCETILASDPNHCGGCGNACSGANMATITCTGGTCDGACATGFADCNGDKRGDGCETNLLTDVANCGGCGVNCAFAHAGATCVAGTCTLGVCDSGWANCDGNSADGCETNISADIANCGACGNDCATVAPPGTIVVGCNAGTCVYTCAPGFADCNQTMADGCEVDIQTDSENCSACGATCGPGTICQDGTCIPGCPSGMTLCGCACIDLMTNPYHCGACGTVCDSFQCSAGTCVPFDFTARQCTQDDVEPCEVFEPFDPNDPTRGGFCRTCRAGDCEFCLDGVSCVRLDCGPCSTCDQERPGQCRPCNPDWCEGCSPSGSGCSHAGCAEPCQNCRFGSGVPGSCCVDQCAESQICVDTSGGDPQCAACFAGTAPCNGPGLPPRNCGTCVAA